MGYHGPPAGGGPRLPPPHHGGRPGPSSSRGHTSASDTEGGSMSGMDSGSEAIPKRRPLPKKSGGANDCEIVVLNKAQQ